MSSSKRRANKKLYARRRKARQRAGQDSRGSKEAARKPGPVLRIRQPPSELDQMGVFIAEPELDLPATDLTGLRDLAERLPFEPAMFHLALLNVRLEPVRDNPEAQWALAQQFYGSRSDLLDRYRRVRADAPARLVFSPQPIALLMRMLIDHAREEEGTDLSGAEFEVLQNAVVGAHSALETALDTLDIPRPEAALAYEIQAAQFFRRPQLLEEMARHQELLRLSTTDERLASSANRVPVADWLAASGMTADEQWATGFSLSAITHAFDAPIRPRALPEHVDHLLRRLGLDAVPRELPVISASREEFRAAFEALGGGEEELAWEVRPFKSTPFLRMADGALLLLAGYWLLSWLGEGFHYRAMTHAQRHEGSDAVLRYSRLNGEVVERYALDLAESAAPPSLTVFGEQPYGTGGGQRTSDVAVIAGKDLILFEVHARRITATAAVSGGAVQATTEISKLLVGKANQVGQCITALLAQDARLPNLDITTIERIWPVVVSVGHVMQTQNLWGYIRSALDPEKMASLSDPRVQPLQLLDIEDYEKIMGLVEAGEGLPAMLLRKTTGPFRERDLAAWLHGDPQAPADTPRLALLERRWEAMADRVTELGDATEGLNGTD